MNRRIFAVLLSSACVAAAPAWPQEHGTKEHSETMVNAAVEPANNVGTEQACKAVDSYNATCSAPIAEIGRSIQQKSALVEEADAATDSLGKHAHRIVAVARFTPV